MFREKLKVYSRHALIFLFFIMTFSLYHNCGQYVSILAINPDSKVFMGILINDGANYTKDLTVNIRFIYNIESPREVFISLIPECTQGSWEAFTPTKSIELNQANKLNTIYAKYKFADELESPCFNSSITHDGIPPRIIINSQPENSPNNTDASFAFQARDNGSGVEKIECRLDNNPSFTVCSSSKNYTNLAPGQHDFHIRAKDRVGNFSPVKTYTWYIGTLDVLGCKTVDPTNLTSTPRGPYPKGTRNAYPSKIFKGKSGNWYYIAWVWREMSGVQTNHSLSVIRSKNLKTWSNTCGEDVTLPISTNSKTVLDPLPQESGLGNNVQLSFDLKGNPIVSYHKFKTLNGKKTTQIYNAYFINNKWTIHQMTEWTILRELSGGGSLPRSDDGVSFSEVQVAQNGNMYQTLRAWSSDSSDIGFPASGTWILEYSNNQLQVTNRRFSKSNTGDDFQSISRKQLPQSALEAESRSFENFEATFNRKIVWASYDSDWVHLYGDWDNDGNTDSGLFDRRLSIFYLYDVSNGSSFTAPFVFGDKSKYFWPLVGAWDNNDMVSIGLWSPSEGVSYIKRYPSSGPADKVIRGSLPSGVTDSPLIWHSHRPDLTHFIKYDVLPGNRDRGYNCDGTKREDSQMPNPSSCWNRFHTKLYLYEYDVGNNNWKTPTLIDNAWGGAKSRFFLKIFKDIKIIVYYDINRQIKVAFKQGNSDWQKQVVDTSVTFNGWDAHNYLAAEIDLNNNIHITGNMHADSMKYWISNGLNLNTFTRQSIQPDPGGTPYPQPDPGKITYPTIFRGPLGKFLFLFRTGGSGNGKWKIMEYNEFTKSWSSFSRYYLFDNI